MKQWQEFIKAGNAIFTVSNKKNNGHFTYKVNKHKEKDLWFVGVLTGPDNNFSYTYLGTIFSDGFRLTRKSKISHEASSYKVFAWLMQRDELPEHIVVDHCGRCGRCGRLLTVPESIRMGYGPECAGFIPSVAKDTVDGSKLRNKTEKLKKKIAREEFLAGPDPTQL
jgi:hypothetical protein